MAAAKAAGAGEDEEEDDFEPDERLMGDPTERFADVDAADEL